MQHHYASPSRLRLYPPLDAYSIPPSHDHIPTRLKLSRLHRHCLPLALQSRLYIMSSPLHSACVPSSLLFAAKEADLFERRLRRKRSSCPHCTMMSKGNPLCCWSSAQFCQCRNIATNNFPIQVAAVSCMMIHSSSRFLKNRIITTDIQSHPVSLFQYKPPRNNHVQTIWLGTLMPTIEISGRCDPPWAERAHSSSETPPFSQRCLGEGGGPRPDRRT